MTDGIAQPDITVIMVSYNTASLLPRALGSLHDAADNLELQVVIVDNASRDDSVDLIRREYSHCELIVNEVNVGFGRANNQALERIRGRYVLLLNTDAFVAPETLVHSMRYMESNPRCGILGARLEFGDGSFQACARYSPTPWNRFLLRTGLNRVFTTARMIDDFTWDQREPRECDWVPGCYYFVRREVIDQIGLFDPRFFLYSEEVDHCLRTRQAGWDVVCYPHTTVVHLMGESTKSDGDITPTGKQSEALQLESDLLYFRKHHGLMGALLNAVLMTLADAVDVAKRFIKRRRPLALGAYWLRIRLIWTLLLRTRFGTVPTR